MQQASSPHQSPAMPSARARTPAPSPSRAQNSCCKTSHLLLLRLNQQPLVHLLSLVVRPLRPRRLLSSSSTPTSTRRSIFEVDTTTMSPSPSTSARGHGFGYLDSDHHQIYDVLHIPSPSAAARRDLTPEQGPHIVGGTLLMNSDSYSIPREWGSTEVRLPLLLRC